MVVGNTELIRTTLARVALVSVCAAAAALAACSPSEGEGTGRGRPTSSGSGATGSSSSGAIGSSGGLDLDSGIVVPNTSAFPAEPLLEPGVDASAPAAFAQAGPFGSGVCVYEPHLSDANGTGALYPQNWLRPRFRWTGTGAETLWEIRLHAASQTNDLVAYTRNTQWLMPKEVWDQIAKSVHEPITVTIRGDAGGTMVGASGDFRIVPVLAGGAMVFWGTQSSVVAPGSSRLFGFAVGDEAVVETLRAEQSVMTGVLHEGGRNLRGEETPVAGFQAGQVRCIGCHVSTPDGDAVAFTDDWPWNKILASVAAGTPGALPAYVSAGAQVLLKMPFLGTQAMSPGHWAAGDRILVTTFGRRPGYVYVTYEAERIIPQQHDLIWIDLETAATLPNSPPPGTYQGPFSTERDNAMMARETAIMNAMGTAWGPFTLQGETGSVSNPDWSNSGALIAYSSSESSIDGHPDWHNNTSDIHLVDYNNRQGGPVIPLPGASDPAALEYYPAFSPDDTLIAFTRAPAPSNTSRCKQDPANGCVNNPGGLGQYPDGPYYNRNGEIFVVGGDGVPVRLRANDPVACSGEVSPGVLNSWPKWSSTPREHEGKRYYFVIFSSARSYPGQFSLTPTEYTPPISTQSSQLYMTAVEVDIASGAILQTYPAIYIWNQNYVVVPPDQVMPLATSNLTPAWEDFSIPEVPPVRIVE
jgi:hypothetical protein